MKECSAALSVTVTVDIVLMLYGNVLTKSKAHEPKYPDQILLMQVALSSVYSSTGVIALK